MVVRSIKDGKEIYFSGKMNRWQYKGNNKVVPVSKIGVEK